MYDLAEHILGGLGKVSGYWIYFQSELLELERILVHYLSLLA